jgi:hypothetical protein
MASTTTRRSSSESSDARSMTCFTAALDMDEILLADRACVEPSRIARPPGGFARVERRRALPLAQLWRVARVDWGSPVWNGDERRRPRRETIVARSKISICPGGVVTRLSEAAHRIS